LSGIGIRSGGQGYGATKRRDREAAPSELISTSRISNWEG
jgi:hypothetical protein